MFCTEGSLSSVSVRFLKTVGCAAKLNKFLIHSRVNWGISEHAQQNANLASCSQQIHIHRFSSGRLQVTHVNMVSQGFRCPSPCWAPFGPTEHSVAFHIFTCHCSPRYRCVQPIIKLSNTIFTYKRTHRKGRREKRIGAFHHTVASIMYRMLQSKRDEMR